MSKKADHSLKDKRRDIYEREMHILQNAETFLAKGKPTKKAISDGFLGLGKHYKDLLEQAKVITQVSDQLGKKLNRVNKELGKKNIELEKTLSALMRAKVSKKAITITFIIFIGLFLLVEGFAEPMLDRFLISSEGTIGLNSDNLFYIGLALKGGLALFLRPIERFIENQLLKQEIRKAQEKDAVSGLSNLHR